MEKITYSCETKDGSRKRIKATPTTLLNVIRQRFHIEAQKELILQTHDAERDRWYDVEVEEYDELDGKDDILVIIRGTREDFLTSSFEESARDMPLLDKAPAILAKHQHEPASKPQQQTQPEQDQPELPNQTSRINDDLFEMFGNTDDLPAAGAETLPSDTDDDDEIDLVLPKSTLTRKRSMSFSDSDDEGVTAKHTKSFSCPLANNEEEQSSSDAAGGPQRPCWPIDFIVCEEHLDVTVKRLLSSKAKLNKNERKKLFAVLYEECVRYEGGYLPSSKMYLQMTNALLAKYPYLRGQAAAFATTTWKTRVNNYFRNTRKRGDREVPEMAKKIDMAASRREKKLHKETYHSVKLWGIRNFKPVPLPGENEATRAVHHETLTKELSKMPNVRNADAIDSCHNKLFPERREFILDLPVKSVRDIGKKYPLLFSYTQILAEYTRLTCENLADDFINGINKYIKLASLKPLKKEEHPLLNIRGMHAECAVEDRRKYYEQCVAVLSVPQQLKEKLSLMFHEEGNQNSYPQLRIMRLSDTIPVEVVVEGVTFCRSSDSSRV